MKTDIGCFQKQDKKVYFFVIRLRTDGSFLSFFQKQAVPPQLAANYDYVDAQESLRAKVSVSVGSSDSLSPMLLEENDKNFPVLFPKVTKFVRERLSLYFYTSNISH